MANTQEGLLIVLSGPSGVGKGTICRKFLNRYTDVQYSVSATTRKPRQGEVNGKEYFFYSHEEFQKIIQAGQFLEWAKVYDNYYGTPLKYVENLLSQGKDCILEIDVQGAMQVKQKMPQGIFIFFLPPSLDELARRLTGRGTEKPAEIKKRIGQAEYEMAQIKDYDYLVINDEINNTVETVRAIIVAERCRIRRMCKE